MDGHREIKIAYIGGGSRAWAKHLMTDLALTPELGGELRLYDIDMRAAQANEKVAADIFGHKDALTKFRVRAVKTPKETLQDADFVVMSIEPGPIGLRYSDLEIPAKYGILQPVGDSTGPGGICRALRTIPVYTDYAGKIMEYCPDAWVINYTNPMTLCTASLFAAAPEIKAIGCCHEIFGTQVMLAKLVAEWFKVTEPARQEIVLDIAGVNHFTFASSTSWNGHDLFPLLRKHIAGKEFFSDRSRKAQLRKKNKRWFETDHLIAYDFLAAFGVLGAAGDRHLAEFVPWYLTSEKDIHRWGIVLTPAKWRIEISSRLPSYKPQEHLKKSGEEGCELMLALLGLKDLYTNANIPNVGQTPFLPNGAVVESYANFSRNNIKPVVSKRLPVMVESLVKRVSEVQCMTLEAALEKNTDLAFQALLNDPLVNIQTDKALKMFSEMLSYQKSMMTGWKI
jgi:alpha-galactosidase